MSFQPSILRGTETPADCENWLDDIEMIFEFLSFPDDCRVKLIGQQLQEVARSWWLVTKEALEQCGPVITWKIFKVEFYQRFFPVSYRQDKCAKFPNLRHGQLNIDEYLAQFFTLLHFAPHVARNDVSVFDQFIQGLNPEIRTLVNVKRQNNLADTLNRAKRAETVPMRQKEGGAASSGSVTRTDRPSAVVHSFQLTSTQSQLGRPEGNQNGRNDRGTDPGCT
ncbi:uncharacterized protein [Primulina eburnea]|uniref:uncharacterized protein n=1 Tax=Primulina eburnea TaxID=1245227 RepID=UPI003C6CB937